MRGGGSTGNATGGGASDFELNNFPDSDSNAGGEKFQSGGDKFGGGFGDLYGDGDYLFVFCGDADRCDDRNF